MKEITKSHVKLLLNVREKNSNKNDYGHALMIAGNKGKMGAAVIAATACLRSGVGLLTVCVHKRNVSFYKLAYLKPC